MDTHAPATSGAAASSYASSRPALVTEGKPAVSVEEETTKRCSACSEDRPESEYSSAQLKKKGKRVCQRCVAKKDAAALAQKAAESRAAAVARKDGMKSAFSARLNATAPHAAAPCARCGAKAIRFAACIRCTVECCSLSCFDHHDCDAYLEAARTMPTELIPKEDQFANLDEMLSLWKELSRYLCSIPQTIPDDALPPERCREYTDTHSSVDEIMSQVDHNAMALFYAQPRVSACWWVPGCCDLHHAHGNVQRFIMSLVSSLFLISQSAVLIFQDCARAHHLASDAELFRGISRPRATLDRVLPGRLTHKMLTLVLFVLRAMPQSWVEKLGYPEQPRPQIDSDAFGLLPCCVPGDSSTAIWRLGYVQHLDPVTGLRSLVPMIGNDTASSCRFSLLMCHLGSKFLMSIIQDGEVAMDRGLYVARSDIGTFSLSAVSGWTGSLSDSFVAAPMHTSYFPTDVLMRKFIDSPENGATARSELEWRKQSNYFHIVPAIKSMLAEHEWPNLKGELLFIPTPQLGIESELVELSLLEALVGEAAAGDQQAQLLIAHIEAECSAPISEVISRQKIRVEQMLADQADQLRIHAEAVQRAEMRGKLKAADGADEGSAASASSLSAAAPTSGVVPASALSASGSASALAPIAAASSAASSLTAVHSASDAPAAVFESAVAYSWTASRAYTSLADLCSAGRKKYSTITSAALRFLHTLKPVSVNRSGGSHTVFHFASGSPVTLVTPHGGDGSVSRHAATRLYAVLHEAALQQLNPTDALPAASSSRRAALTDAAH